MPAGPSPAVIRFSSPRHSDRCRWLPFPSPPVKTTGANETSIPCAAATARVVNRNSSSRSAASSGLDGAIETSNWPGAFTAWGIENREAALRFVPGTVTSRNRSANFEVKVVDGAANPYYALAGCLHAGRSGIERGATLPQPTQEDPGVLDTETLVARGIRRLPVDLGEAAEAFAASAALREGLGDTMHDVIAGVRRKEWQDHGAKSEEELVELHRFAY